MTDKTDLLLEVIENPGNFSDEQLEEILRDPETRELYRLLSKTGDALADSAIPDIDREWERLKAADAPARKRNASAFRDFLGRRRAAVAVTAIIALGAVAAGIGVGVRYASHRGAASRSMNVNDFSKAEKLVPKLASDTIIQLSSKDAKPDTVLFKNENLDVIIKEVGRYYGAEPRFDNPASKELRLYFKWDQSRPLSEIVEQLNGFEQINITLSDKSLIIR